VYNTRPIAAEATTNPISPRHRLKKPIHNVKERAKPSYRRRTGEYRFLNPGEILPMLRSICCSKRKIGGAYRDRTDDLMLAKQPLSQLS
jgi:hypothetical protein